MKIGFDVSDLCTNRADGTTRYTRELAKRLPGLSPVYDWQYFAPCDKRNDRLLSDVSNVTWRSSPWPKYWTQMRLPFDLLRHQPDVLFMPIQQLPYLRPGRMKTVAVLHDLAVHSYPEQFTYRDWLLLHVFSAYAVRQADAIIAVSRATANDIARYYGRTDNVHVVHHGLDHRQFYEPGEEEKASAWQLLQTTHPSLRQPYLLYVGQIQPRKNLNRLVDAFALAKKQVPDLQLVVAGAHGWLTEPIFDHIHKSAVKDSIILAGRVPDKLLPALYWHAEVFVLPSLYEGFGMPIVEAFACGCPVVTSNVSSLPEVAGQAAILIDPTDTSSLVDGIKTALNNKLKLRRAGLARAKQFDWDKTARKTLEVITATVTT